MNRTNEVEMLSFVKSQLASTFWGKSEIRKELLDSIKTGRARLNETAQLLAKVDSVQRHPKLKKAFNDLQLSARKLISATEEESTMTLLVDTTASAVSRSGDADGFKAKVLESDAYHQMEGFAYNIIGIESYKALSIKVKDFHTFKGGNVEDLKTLLDYQELLTEVNKQHAKLDIDKVATQTQTMCLSLSEELELTEDEAESVKALFTRFREEFLPELNEARKEIMAHLPTYFASEKARILNKHPHLALQLEPKQQMHTPLREQQSTAKGVKKAKGKEAKPSAEKSAKSTIGAKRIQTSGKHTAKKPPKKKQKVA